MADRRLTLAEWDAATLEQRAEWLAAGRQLRDDDAAKLRERIFGAIKKEKRRERGFAAK